MHVSLTHDGCSHSLNSLWTVSFMFAHRRSVASGYTYIAHRLSVAVLCMLYLMPPLHDALPGQYVPVQVTRGALVAHRYTYVPPSCRTSQYRMTFVPLSVSL